MLRRSALADIDLQIEEGQSHAIIGPNDAGKSPLLNVCIGKLAPTSVAAVFDGQVLTGKKPYEINQFGVARVFQTPEIFSDLSVLHNVMIPALAKRDGAFKQLLLDEPYEGLAPVVVHEIERILHSVKGLGITTIIVEQNAVAALQLADRAVILDAVILDTGEIAFSGTARQVLDNFELRHESLVM
jgi:ABC-type branched-subunit amino acid transport system ATPase component